MRKIVGWLVVLLFLALYIISDSPLMAKIARKRYYMSSLFASDRYRFGDLYGFSYLKEYKFLVDFYHNRYDDTISYSGCSARKDINLYSICDSYLFNFLKGEKDFCRVNKYAFIGSLSDGKLNLALDTAMINVLLIENTERNIRQNLSDTAFFAGRLTLGQGPEGLIPDPPGKKNILLMSFNRGINDNLEFNLFDYHFLSPVKELKAWFNKTIFNRVDGDVSVSSEGDRLYYRRTTDTAAKAYSSFATLTDEDIARDADNLNKVVEGFKRMGFNYVYFCGIPNPCTVYELGYRKYNEFLPRLQYYPNPHVQFIDMYSIFMKDRRPELYLRSDSHWDSAGFRRWQSAINNVLDTLPDRYHF